MKMHHTWSKLVLWVKHNWPHTLIVIIDQLPEHGGTHGIINIIAKERFSSSQFPRVPCFVESLLEIRDRKQSVGLYRARIKWHFCSTTSIKLLLCKWSCRRIWTCMWVQRMMWRHQCCQYWLLCWACGKHECEESRMVSWKTEPIWNVQMDQKREHFEIVQRSTFWDTFIFCYCQRDRCTAQFSSLLHSPMLYIKECKEIFQSVLKEVEICNKVTTKLMQ